MALLDRWIASRFLVNFVLIFAVMFLFAISIDTILQLDAYTAAARRAVEMGSYSSMWSAVPIAVLDFNLPRVFQFYAYLLGLCSVAAAGFTLAQMVRTRELVAMLAAGVSLWRVGLVMVVVAVLLNLVQLLNGEILLPRLAPLLVREHNAILRPSVEKFGLNIVQDGAGKLVLAQAFDPMTETAFNLLVLERDEKGAAVRRIEAPTATWDEVRGGWSGRRRSRAQCSGKRCGSRGAHRPQGAHRLRGDGCVSEGDPHAALPWICPTLVHATDQ